MNFLNISRYKSVKITTVILLGIILLGLITLVNNFPEKQDYTGNIRGVVNFLEKPSSLEVLASSEPETNIIYDNTGKYYIHGKTKLDSSNKQSFSTTNDTQDLNITIQSRSSYPKQTSISYKLDFYIKDKLIETKEFTHENISRGFTHQLIWSKKKGLRQHGFFRHYPIIPSTFIR